MKSTKSGKRPWTVVLAGGEGERMRGTIQRWLGHHRPKQYCSFTGDGSMLEYTWGRAVRLSPRERVITVIGRGHWAHVESLACQDIPGLVIEQPANKNTAPGVFLPLSYVLAADPGATAVLLPSDHYINPEEPFLACVESAVEMAEEFAGRIVLLAAEPDGPNPDYGWIEAANGEPPGGPAGARAVLRFREKPSREEAVQFFLSGFLWNTMVTVAKAQTLWDLGRKYLPDMMEKFALFRASIGSPQEPQILKKIYGDLRDANFSSSLLEPAAPESLVLKMKGVAWSDWGRPERIEETLLKAGRSVTKPAAV